MASFSIEWGVPEMLELRRDLQSKLEREALDRDERRLFRKLQKCVLLLADNPKHSGLECHEIAPLSARYGQKVFQAYLENKTPAAGRLYWVYGPERGVITIIGLEPHPESAKSRGYDRLKLSAVRRAEGEKRSGKSGGTRMR